MPQNWRQPLAWVLRANAVLLAIDILLIPFLALYFNVDIFTAFKSGYLTFMLFVEAGIIFLVGGVIAMSSSIFFSKVREYVFHSEEKWSVEKEKKGEAKANLYILTGVLLFLESLIFAFLIT